MDFHFLNFSTRERFFQLATLFLRNKNTLSLQETTVSLESYQKAETCVRKVFTNKGTSSSNSKIIMNELEDFHTGLYDCDVNLTECANLFLKNSEILELLPEKKATWEGKLTVEECL